MITVRVWFVLMLVAAAFVGRQLWTATTIRAHAADFTVAPSTAVMPSVNDDPRPAHQPQLDVYGNEVDDAVGDYRMDAFGEQYEGHSPETELLRLGSPVI
jgi:hypothetical protein